MKKVFPILLLAFLLLNAFTFKSLTEDWKLAVDKGGVKVYTSKSEDSKLYATRVVMDLSLPVSKVEGIILDVTNHKSWMETIVLSEKLPNDGPGTMFSYYKSDVPWPVTDRDVVLKWEKKKEGETTVIKSHTIAGKVPEVEGLIRVPLQDNEYRLTPNAQGGCHFDYKASADPGGSIPAWFANQFITDVPFKTWTRFREKFDGK
ncbi:MAG: hypothetical protein H6581_17970 [Bacteroidia bacterium]|nr:hypothetical protein [Bacteroidia bacterium]